MKRFMVLCLTAVFSILFVACEKSGQDVTIESATDEGSWTVPLNDGGCVTLKDNERINIIVKKDEKVLCSQIHYQGCEGAGCAKKCIDDSLLSEENFKWNSVTGVLIKASAAKEGCSSLKYEQKATQQAPVATGEQAADDGKQGGPAPAGQGGGTAGSQAAPAAGQGPAAPAAPASEAQPAAEQQGAAGQEQPESGGEQQQEGSQPAESGGEAAAS